MKKLSIVTMFIFVFAMVGCCGEAARKKAMYPKPENLAQKIANYVIKNGEQTCTLKGDTYKATTLEVPGIVEETKVTVKKKDKGLLIRVTFYGENDSKFAMFEMYNSDIDADLDVYYEEAYDKNGKTVNKMRVDLNKKQICLGESCEELSSAESDLYQAAYQFHLYSMAMDLLNR